MARFDWYQATVRRPVYEVREALHSLGASVGLEEQRKAPQGYGAAWRVLADGATVAQLWAGGSQPHPHLVFTGEDAPTGAAFLRATFPDDHLVTRLDSCLDYPDPGAYDTLQARCLEVAKARKVKIDTRGDHLVTLEGRTLYLGSTKSATRLRLYDKAAEMRAKLRADQVALLEVPEHLARLEVQVRPQTFEARCLAARAEPLSMFGSSAWTRELIRQVEGLDVEPCSMERAWRRSDDDRAYMTMLAQYGAVLGRIGLAQGWECLGLQIRDDLASQAAAKKKRLS